MRARRRGKGAAWLAGLAVLAVGAGMALFNLDRIQAELRLHREFESLGKNPQGYRVYRHRQTGIRFVRLPGGTFLMGSPEDEEGRREDELLHRVTVSPFLIAEEEITHFFARDSDSCLSWDGAQEFCRRYKFELPTEAEWEYACRGGSTTPFAFGSLLPTANLEYRQDLPWEKVPSAGIAYPRMLAAPPPNGFGLYIMHGSFWEWCRDTYDRDFYRTPKASGVDPVNASDSNAKVLRGGSWKSVAADCRSARRMAGTAFLEYADTAFRPVWSFYPSKD
jgi:formylglycine-generating enzyme required for sulfatase activity